MDLSLAKRVRDSAQALILIVNVRHEYHCGQEGFLFESQKAAAQAYQKRPTEHLSSFIQYVQTWLLLLVFFIRYCKSNTKSNTSWSKLNTIVGRGFRLSAQKYKPKLHPNAKHTQQESSSQQYLTPSLLSITYGLIWLKKT